MRARRIIEGSAFQPEVISAATAAFEAAWTEIAGCFQPNQHEAARESLALAIISAIREDSVDTDLLRRVGITAMARAYPSAIGSSEDDSATGRS